MRIHIKTTPNKKEVPFNYQPKLVGTIHKWLGENNYHGNTSLFSFSWLEGGKVENDHLSFPSGASWFISSHDDAFIRTLVSGLMTQTEIFNGMAVLSIDLQSNPVFPENYLFHSVGASLIKRKREDKTIQYFTFDHPDANKYLTESMKYKLEKAGLESNGVSIEYKPELCHPKTKLVTYDGIKIKANNCSVMIHGTQEQRTFAWNVGIGNSTGIGFGAIR